MTLTNLIDLIAEVAAKRATREGGTKEETQNAIIWMLARKLAGIKPLLHISFNFGLYSFRTRRSLVAKGDSK